MPNFDTYLYVGLSSPKQLEERLALIREAVGANNNSAGICGAADYCSIVVIESPPEKQVNQEGVTERTYATSPRTDTHVSWVGDYDIRLAYSVQSCDQGAASNLIISRDQKKVLKTGRGDPLLVYPAQVPRLFVVRYPDTGICSCRTLHELSGAIMATVVKQEQLVIFEAITECRDYFVNCAQNVRFFIPRWDDYRYRSTHLA
ncbi:MAG: hypothetical protein V7609_1917 [Verrucomicrobiota bacterium]